ncbi:envelope integrity protein Cei [Amycolatopsis sp. 195334CR]|uniref:envelope integrity protein Cei n=1 Tax=Amycolatopsis sp. 195334CR TaxID=2814588 RepID=UPI001A8D9E28|nr:envelope integrity protein Cei [Amycolatopsis sp. 195334CR]MBN6038714.1 envelope integrity protein Cei [Amycolatopsis sp. 195334CR]
MASGNGKSRLYRKRRPWPALIVIGVLGVIAMGVWINALLTKDDINDAIRCEPAPVAPEGVTYTPVAHDALDDTAPIPPGKISLKVLNAGGTRGQGAITTATLRELGFTEAADPANDPAYESTEAKCRGQIRYGENGRAAARTLSLVDPCVELVEDNRQDASVDLSIGTKFGDPRPNQAGLDILKELSDWSSKNQESDSGGNEQSTGQTAPTIEKDRLAAARTGYC